jgi:hypothetical protein
VKAGFSDLRGSDLPAVFQATSELFPGLTLRIWGHGEEYFDIWSRGFRAGQVISACGPFEASG